MTWGVYKKTKELRGGGILDIFGKGAAFFGTLLVGIVTQATGSVNLGAIPIVCLFAAGIAVFIIAARVNRPFLAKQTQEETAEAVQDGTDLPDENDSSDKADRI